MQKEKAEKAREPEPLLSVKVAVKIDADLPESFKKRTGIEALKAGSVARLFVTRAELDKIGLLKGVKMEVIRNAI